VRFLTHPFFALCFAPASKLRKAGIFSRVDDSNTSIGKRYARNDELGTPFGVTLDFACEYGPLMTSRQKREGLTSHIGAQRSRTGR